MRLGQLARKLDLRPAEIIEFLATKNIVIEDDVNAKVEDNYVTLVFRQFAPDVETENSPPIDIAAAGTSHEPIGDVNEMDEKPVASSPASESIPERIEVIKAPKVELSGLKVLGKIDLPDTKKKQSETSQENSETEQPQEVNREKRSQAHKKKPTSPQKSNCTSTRKRSISSAEKKGRGTPTPKGKAHAKLSQKSKTTSTHKSSQTDQGRVSRNVGS